MDTMTPDEARAILDRMGWNQTYLAQRLGRDDSRLRRQLRGAEPFDADLARWLRAVDHLMRNPPPKPARRGPPDGSTAAAPISPGAAAARA